MRATLRRMIAILDGTPTGVRGQSLVELTLTLPVLFVMLLGLTEIGWYANNYLTLLDVVREAGRAGANSTGTRDPLVQWSIYEELNYHRLDCDETLLYYDKEALPKKHIETPQGPDATYPTNSAVKYFDGDERPLGFYDFVACTVIPNMSPMEFNDETDDIVVSVFSYLVEGRETANPKVRVLGRYPSRTNECENDDQWDPFDLNHNGSGSDEGLFDQFDEGADNVRGYVFRGNHKNDYGGSVPCLGSEFSTQRVEDMLNLITISDNGERLAKLEHVPNYGMVLVEIYWQHKQLLGLPWYNLGPLDEAQIIHVWTFFPVSAAEPDVD